MAIVHRRDDDDDKLVIVDENFSPSDEEILKLVNFQEKYFDHIIER